MASDMAGSGVDPGVVEKFLRGLLSSPSIRPEHRAQLAALASRLTSLGLLPAGAVL